MTVRNKRYGDCGIGVGGVQEGQSVVTFSGRHRIGDQPTIRNASRSQSDRASRPERTCGHERAGGHEVRPIGRDDDAVANVDRDAALIPRHQFSLTELWDVNFERLGLGAFDNEINLRAYVLLGGIEQNVSFLQLACGTAVGKEPRRGRGLRTGCEGEASRSSVGLLHFIND